MQNNKIKVNSGNQCSVKTATYRKLKQQKRKRFWFKKKTWTMKERISLLAKSDFDANMFLQVFQNADDDIILSRFNV